ncbi:mechanosensitive ion channel family protein [Oscillibacter hominis]|nr:mechanosensitive ion channel family protein [Oscillibacter hominis]
MDLTKLLGAQIGSLSIGRLISGIVTALVCLVAVRVLGKLAKKLLGRTRLDERIRRYVLSAVRVVLWIVTIIIVMESLDIPSTSLVALLSVTSLAFSLAAENVLSNMAGGLVILVNKPFNLGDFIEASGVSGTVAEITLNYTKLDTIDGRRVLMPNKELSASRLTNFTVLGRRRAEHRVTASYEDRPETVCEALLKAAAMTGHVLKEPAPSAQIESYGDSSIEYSLRCWAETEHYWAMYYDLLSNIKRAFDDAGVTMTYNHLNVHLMREGE